MEAFVFQQEYGRGFGAAQMPGCIDDHVEHRLQRVRRARDDFQHVGCRGLELQRFAQVLGAFLHFLEQADIADGDYGLVGKGLQQRDLLVAERMHLCTPKQDCADTFILAQQRHAQ